MYSYSIARLLVLGKTSNVASVLHDVVYKLNKYFKEKTPKRKDVRFEFYLTVIENVDDENENTSFTSFMDFSMIIFLGNATKV